MPKHKPKDYQAIAAWGKYLSSKPYYIATEQESASDAQAPLDALYETHGPHGKTGRWRCLSDLSEGHEFRAFFDKWKAEQTVVKS